MDELLIKYVLDETTDDECRRVEAWAAESQENRRRLEEFRRVWAFGRKTAGPVRTEESEALARLRQRMAPSEGLKVQPTVRRMRAQLAAAVIVGLLAVGIGTWVVLRQKKTQPVVTTAPVRGSAETMMVIRNAPDLPRVQKNRVGELPRDTLPTGLVFFLQKGSKIEWLSGGGYHRHARLTGNAKFVVNADPAHPFIVETALLRVKVLGTVFRVIDDADSAVVLVDTGGVLAVTDRDSAILRGGERAVTYPDSRKLTVRVDRERLDNKEVMRRLIDELIREGLVRDRESLGWLALDSRQLVIDGVDIPDPAKARYQSKYLLPDGMGFYYGKVKVHGHGYFYEKKELY
jgi:ferric-dicitrate binding protein FerR (iron transport regulator)